MEACTVAVAAPGTGRPGKGGETEAESLQKNGQTSRQKGKNMEACTVAVAVPGTGKPGKGGTEAERWQKKGQTSWQEKAMHTTETSGRKQKEDKDRDRDTKKESEKASGMTILCGNVTTFGKKAKRCLAEEAPKFDGILIQEHHQDMKQCKQMQQWVHTMLGMRSWISPAASTHRSDSGTSGGTMVAIKRHIAITPASTKGWHREACERNDWSLVGIRVKGTTIMLASIYLTSGLGYAGENIAKLTQLMCELRSHRLPFVIQGDWNMPPEELKTTPWFATTGGVVITPRGVRATCTQGQRIIDYVVATAEIAPLISLVPVLETTWRPHLGMALTIDRRPRSYQILTRQKPGPILADTEAEKPRTTTTTTWKEAKEKWTEENSEKAIQEITTMEGAQATAAQRHNSNELGLKYAKWSSTAEQWMLDNQRGGEDEEGQTAADDSKAMGRGQVPKFTRQPAVEATTPGSEKRDHESRAWGSAVHQLEMMIKLRSRRTRCQQAEAIERHLKTKGAEAIEKHTYNEAEGKEWADKFREIGKQPKWKQQQTLEIAETMLQRAERRAAAKETEMFEELLRKALKRGAGQAHKWVKKPLSPAPIDETIENVADDPDQAMEHRRNFWNRLWQDPGGDTEQEIAAEYNQLCQQAQEEDPLPPITSSKVANIVQGMRSGRAAGIDSWIPAECNKLPREAWQDMTD